MRALPPSAALLLAGCGALPARLRDCPDQDCALRWLEQAYAREGAEGLQEILALPPTPGREALVQVVVERWPGESAPLCLALADGPGLARCQALVSRPHLWQVDEDEPGRGTLGAGCAYPALRGDPSAWDHPWRDSAPLTVDCPPGRGANSCHEEAADRAAQDGRYEEAWRICLGLDAGKWRDECFFEASEGAWAPDGRGDPAMAARLCAGAGLFFDRCLGHLAGKIGRDAPAASAEDPARWERLGESVAAIRGAIEPFDPSLAVRWAGLAWSQAMASAYTHEEEVHGNPLDAVEPAAWPHVRAAAAWTLWLRGGERVRDLATWGRDVEASLARRAPAGTVPGPTGFEERNLGSPWIEDLPGEEALPWVSYRGSVTRRAVSDDHEVDAIICVLEAAARNPTRQREALLREGLDHPDRLVRWTAARLAFDLAPAALAGRDPAAEPDPLVRARLAR